MSRSFVRWQGWVLLCCAGLGVACGSTRMRSVQPDHWQAVPVAWREKIERVHAAVIAGAEEERRAATAAVAEARRALDRRVVVATRASGPVEGDQVWQEAWRAYEREQAAALARIDSSQQAWLHALLRWRERRLAAADLHVAVVRADFELAKAEAVSGYTPGDEDYDVAGFRGQFARLHESWWQARQRANAARAAADAESRALAKAKEGYARLRREGPTPPAAVQAAAQIEAEALRKKPVVPHMHVW